MVIYGCIFIKMEVNLMDTIIDILTGIFGDFDLDSIIAFIKEFFIMPLPM